MYKSYLDKYNDALDPGCKTIDRWPEMFQKCLSTATHLLPDTGRGSREASSSGMF